MADIPVPPPPPPPSDPPPPIIQPDQPQSGGPSPPSRSTRSTPRSDAEAPHDDSSDDEGEDEDVEDPTQRPTMVVLWAGISTFFVETSVHGFKYIVEDTAALWEKLFWTITLCLSLTTAGVLFSDSIIDWQESPMSINVAESGLSVRLLDFPAVTVCQDENDNYMDRWYFIEALLNMIDLQCQRLEKADRPQTCEYLQRVYDIVWNIGAYDTLEDLFMASEDLVRGQILYEKLVQVLSIEKQELLRKMELVTFFTDNEQWVMDSFKKVLGKTEQDFENFENLVDKSFSGISASSDVNCYDYPSCWEAFKTFFRQILLTESTNSPIGMKGSLITHFAHYLHGSFQYSADWLISQNNLDANSAGAKFIHEYFKMLTAGMTGDSISLLDVPALMSKSQPFINVLERDENWNSQPATELISRDCDSDLFRSYSGYWKAFQDATYTGQNECSLDDSNNTCCNYWEKSFGSNLQALMLIMKYSQLSSKANDAVDESTKDFLENNLVLENLGFTNSSEYSKDESTKLRNIRNSLLVSCAYGSSEIEDMDARLRSGDLESLSECRSFDPMPTNLGICHTFNAVSFKGMARDNHYMNTFINVFHPKESDEVQKITGTGIENGFQFILDANKMGRPYMQPGDGGPANFKISLSGIYNPFDVKSGAMSIRAGTITRVRITPAYTSSAPGLQGALDINSRQCRFRDENELLKIFANYTRSACRFECMLERAHESCGCTPWNFPYIGKGDMEICDMFGSTCFYDLMSDIGYGEQCACEEDCDEVSFTKFETNKNLNADELCTDTNSWVYKYMQTVKRNVEGYDYRASVKKVLYKPYVDQSVIDEEECRYLVKNDLAIVTMEISSTLYSELQRQEATTIADQLANLGGTLGLFSGMSVLSFIEIFFWARRIIFEVIAHYQLKRARNIK